MSSATNTVASKKKWRFQIPHEYVVLIVLLIIGCVLTYIIPAGAYDRIQGESGPATVDPDSFHLVERTPVPIWEIPNYILNSLVKNAESIFSIMVMTASLGVVIATDVFKVFSDKLSRAMQGKQKLFIPVMLLIFVAMSTTQQVMAFIGFAGLSIILAKPMGYDALVGMGIIFIGASLSFATSILSPMVALAQNLAGLEAYSGMWLRAVALVVLFIATAGFLMHYGEKVRKDPTKSIIYGDKLNEDVEVAEAMKVEKHHVAVLVIVLAGFAVLIFGCLKYAWALTETAIVFLWMAIAASVACGHGPSKIAASFSKGIGRAASAAMIVGIGAALVEILSAGNIMDTVVHGLAVALENTPTFLKAPALLLANMIVSIVITSGGGHASVVMPLLAPVCDVVGMSRQLLVLAFRLGDGLCGCIQPHNPSLMGFLAVVGISYSKWMKFFWKLFLILTVLGAVILYFGQIVGY